MNVLMSMGDRVIVEEEEPLGWKGGWEEPAANIRHRDIDILYMHVQDT